MQLRLLVAERLVEDFVEHFALGTAPTLYQSILEVTLRDLYIYVYVYIYIHMYKYGTNRNTNCWLNWGQYPNSKIAEPKSLRLLFP